MTVKLDAEEWARLHGSRWDSQISLRKGQSYPGNYPRLVVSLMPSSYPGDQLRRIEAEPEVPHSGSAVMKQPRFFTTFDGRAEAMFRQEGAGATADPSAGVGVVYEEMRVGQGGLVRIILVDPTDIERKRRIAPDQTLLKSYLAGVDGALADYEVTGPYHVLAIFTNLRSVESITGVQLNDEVSLGRGFVVNSVADLQGDLSTMIEGAWRPR